MLAGELAAERERNRPTAKPNSPETQSPYRAYISPRSKGEIAVCMSPPKPQATAAATAVAGTQRQPSSVEPAVPPVTQATASMQRVCGVLNILLRSVSGHSAIEGHLCLCAVGCLRCVYTSCKCCRTVLQCHQAHMLCLQRRGATLSASAVAVRLSAVIYTSVCNQFLCQNCGQQHRPSLGLERKLLVHR